MIIYVPLLKTSMSTFLIKVRHHIKEGIELPLSTVKMLIITRQQLKAL